MDHRLPFKLKAAPDFDFDEWAALYQSDPAAFEARRSALIAIELAKGGAYAAPTAKMLLELQERSANLTPEQRLQLASQAMIESGRLLAKRLGELSADLSRLAAEPDASSQASQSGQPSDAAPQPPALDPTGQRQMPRQSSAPVVPPLPPASNAASNPGSISASEGPFTRRSEIRPLRRPGDRPDVNDGFQRPFP